MKRHYSLARTDRGEWPSSAAVSPVSQRPLRVALFSGNYNCVRDGANQALNRLVAFLQAEAGADVRVYSPTVPNPAFEPAGDLVSVPSFGIPGRREYRLARALPNNLRDDIRAFAPDVIHLSAPDILGRSAQRFARQLGVPVVTSLHTRFETYLAHYGLGFLKRRIERYLGDFYASSDHVLVPNAMIADEMRDAGLATEISVWGRGVDRTIFTPRRRDMEWRRSHGYADDDVVVLFFGRLVREKGLDVFADVIDAARAMGCRLRPLVVGDGPGRAEFARRLSNVNFVGHLAGGELGRAVASADILLNPSVTEAFGNVTLEAMAAGLAIVSADVPSARSLVENGRTGLLVPARDVGAYAAAIERLTRIPMDRARLAKAAVAEAGRYEWNATLQAVLDAYQHCLAGDRPGA